MAHPYFKIVLSLLILLNTYQSIGQTIEGETTIALGQTYTYTCSFGCTQASYRWTVSGGTIVTNNGSTISVTWNCSTNAKNIQVSVDGQEYDSQYDYWYDVHCGDGYIDSFNETTPFLGPIHLANSLTNEICANEPFFLTATEFSGVASIEWSQWNGASWVSIGTSSDPGYFPFWNGIQNSTLFKAQPVSSCGTLLSAQTYSVNVRDIATSGGIAVGERDVLFNNNQGIVTLADYSGQITGWQYSENGGGSWIDLNQTSEEIEFSALLTTTSFRAKVTTCGTTRYSQSCIIRVTNGNLSWVEEKSFNESGTVISNSRSYFDLIGRRVQTQVKNLSENKILASQPLFGKYDQVAGTTLSAPITETSFTYKPNFVTASSAPNTPFSYQHFDTENTINNPAGLSNSNSGTLGWYYSMNNTLEPHLALTSYPYTNTQEISDGSTGVIRSSGVGEVFRMGQGKENIVGTFAVRNELDTYSLLRNRYYSTTIIGEQTAGLSSIATQQVSVNANGEKVISIQDKEGRTVMTARPASTSATSWLGTNSVVEIGWPYSFHKGDNQLFENPVIYASSDIMVYDANNNRVFMGHARDFDLSNRPGYYNIYCNEPFRVTASRILEASTGQSYGSNFQYASVKREAYAYFNFYTLAAGNASVSAVISGSDYTVRNSATGADVTSIVKSNGALPAGFYQIRLLHGIVQLTYQNKYQDISYSFFNQKGNLLGSLAPNGVQRVLEDLNNTNLATYPTAVLLPFYTSYEYDVQGRLLAQTETDAGRTEFFYRTDGKIRFSQNAKQRPIGHFSYTNYDAIGRPVESGECRPSASTYFTSIATSPAVLESTAKNGGVDGSYERFDVVCTTYDLPDPVPGLGSAYTQSFLAGRVSSTLKYRTYRPDSGPGIQIAQTWFSYDEQGRTTWIVKQQFRQYPHALDYTYDLPGNILSVSYQKNEPAYRFTHYYSYDADQRLREVRTNNAAPDDIAAPKKLQASYSYYLHGPLKRIQIGGMQGVDYLYTAQGWLKSINGVRLGDDPAHDAPTTSGMLPDLFSQELEYYAGDYYSQNHDEGVFYSIGNHPDRFDGSLRGLTWRTPTRTLLQGYGYRYDERGQLSQADYGQPQATTGNSLQFNLDPQLRYIEGNLEYDPNGNLTRLRRTNRLGSDQLNINYHYNNNTNKLNRVRHPQLPNAPIIDYTYDELGRMTSQLEPTGNKYLDYDVTGKVSAVYRDAAKRILLARYEYNEYGQRIRHTGPDDENGYPTVTEYVHDLAGNEVASYYYDPVLEGTRLYEQPIYGASRLGVRRQSRDTEGLDDLYELHDQLGNTRIVFRQPRSETYRLTMEQNNVDQEKKDFPTPGPQTYDLTRSTSYARRNSPYGTQYSVALSSQVGPGKTLTVAPGDQVRLEVWAAYPYAGTILGRTAPLVSIVSGNTSLTSQKPKTHNEKGISPKPSTNWQRLLGQFSIGIAIPLSSSQPSTSVARPITPTPPNAVLRYVLRRTRDNALIRSAESPITNAAEGTWELLNLNVNNDTDEPTNLEVVIENRDATLVYFDDLQIMHNSGPIVEENHFYAYGQRNEGLSWTRQYVRNLGRGYQGQYARHDEDTGYENFELRMYDARIGRWLAVDPLRQHVSPYIGMSNNPVNNIDPTGGADEPKGTKVEVVNGKLWGGYTGEVRVTPESSRLAATQGLIRQYPYFGLMYSDYANNNPYSPYQIQAIGIEGAVTLSAYGAGLNAKVGFAISSNGGLGYGGLDYGLNADQLTPSLGWSVAPFVADKTTPAAASSDVSLLLGLANYNSLTVHSGVFTRSVGLDSNTGLTDPKGYTTYSAGYAKGFGYSIGQTKTFQIFKFNNPFNSAIQYANSK